MSEGEPETWIEWFCSQRGHELFCEVDVQYIGKQQQQRACHHHHHHHWHQCNDLLFGVASADAFNLYGLRSIIPNFRDCLEIILGLADSGE